MNTQRLKSRTSRYSAVLAMVGLVAVAGCGSDGDDKNAAATSNAPVSTSAPGSAASSATALASLTVGSDLTYPPYAFQESGAPAGFDADLVNAVAAEIGMKPEFADTRFEQLIPNLKSGRFDLIASALYITAERAKEVDYIAYFTTGNSIVVQSSATNKPATVSELCGQTVALIKGAAVAKSLNDEAKGICEASQAIKVREFPTDPEATQALLAGQVTAQITDAAVAKVAVDKTGGKLIITSKELLYPIPAGMAVKKGNAELAAKVKQGLDKLTASGKYQELLDKYNLRAPDPAEVAKILGS